MTAYGFLQLTWKGQSFIKENGMSEKDLDIAIEKCERIMEFDTRTLKDPESENGFLFDSVYDLLKFLRQLRFDTDTNVCGTDTISRQAAIDSVRKAKGKGEAHRMLIQLPPAQPGWTYIEEALPATIINKHTNDYQEYNCLCDFGDYGFDVRTYKFGNGHFWNGGGIVDKYVTAWQPLPEIPDALKPKPWERGQE